MTSFNTFPSSVLEHEGEIKPSYAAGNGNQPHYEGDPGVDESGMPHDFDYPGLEHQDQPIRTIPQEARVVIDALHASAAARRAERGELPPSERPSSDAGITARYAINRGMPFHSPRV